MSAAPAAPAALAAAIRSGDRAALARGITLVESQLPEHERQAAELMQLLHGVGDAALRVGVCGAPGVGKSTFLEAFGNALIARGESIAVLAVDPTSQRSGGSILGDKTRMERLARAPQAFIRPSPGGDAGGGIARRTREAARLCAAAGFGVVCIETIGIGQAEVAIADLVDCCILLLLAQAGDELQGIKRGIMEVADVVVLHKADGAALPLAEAARAEMTAALRLLRGETAMPRVLCASSRTGAGIGDVVSEVSSFATPEQAGARKARRRAQDLLWFDRSLRDRLLQRLQADPAHATAIAQARAAVASGAADPLAAAEQALRGAR